MAFDPGAPERGLGKIRGGQRFETDLTGGCRGCTLGSETRAGGVKGGSTHGGQTDVPVKAGKEPAFHLKDPDRSWDYYWDPAWENQRGLCSSNPV